MTKKRKLATRADPLAVTRAPCCGRCSMWATPDEPDKDPFGECGRVVMTTTVLRPVRYGGQVVLPPLDEDDPAEPFQPLASFGSLVDFSAHVGRRRPPKRRVWVETRRIDPGEIFSRQELMVVERSIPVEPMRTRSWAPACSLYVVRMADRSEWAMFREAMDEWDYWMGGAA